MKAYRYMEDNMGDTPIVKLFILDVIKTTPYGYWVSTPYDKKGKHFIMKSTHKKYAHLNKKDALTSFIKRKESHVSILKNQLQRAEESLANGLVLIKDGK